MSLSDTMAQQFREYLEEVESDLSESLIDIVESLQTLIKHLADGHKLTKDNLAAVSKSIRYNHITCP
jgi:hypothetical protein